MAGQSKWGNAADSTNAYAVRFNLEKELYYFATYGTIFGKFNNGREVTVIEKTFGMNTIKIDAGNDSPVWEKTMTQGNETRFTTREENIGNATYGDANVQRGDFAKYMHSVVYTRTVHSPAYPVPGIESKEQIKELIQDLVKVEKENIGVWGGKEMDLDGFRSALCGASRGLLKITEGGLGVTLYGGSAGQVRSPYNVTVGGDANIGTLLTPSAVLATHEAAVDAGLHSLTNVAEDAFGYAEHEGNSFLIDNLDIKPVKIGNQQYRSLALADTRLISRLQKDSTLSTIMQNAYARAKDNPAIYRMNAFVLDDILYVACKQLEFFRPTSTGTGTLTWGAGITQDPRSSTFSNTSAKCIVMYLGAGALLRAKRNKIWWTDKIGDHGQDAEYATHYSDGWMRHDLFTKDDRTATMKNDSMLVGCYYDPGVGKAMGS